MKKILFIGEHPAATTGNSGMMLSILSDLDTTKYQPNVFALESLPPDPLLLVSRTFPFSIINAPLGDDPFGADKLLRILERSDLDAIVMVGIDIWTYAGHMEIMKELTRRRGISWISIFPYDLQVVRKDWLKWIDCFTHPYVYSKWGVDLLKRDVPNIKYFRPALRFPDIWRKLPEKEKKETRRVLFPMAEDAFVFGFVGSNQIRKDPQKVIKAFSIVKKKIDRNLRLYLHTNLRGIFDLQQFGMDCGLKTRDVLTCRPGEYYTLEHMVKMYNSLDCLVNCSYQEGLSWTLIEAMLCGTPFIATRTTAQIELLEGAGVSIPCEELAYTPLVGAHGNTWIESKACKVDDLVDAMCDVAMHKSFCDKLSEDGLQKGKEWLKGVSNINEILDEVVKHRIEVKPDEKKKAILFSQHSSAGDVLMTTRCFKGLKERYKLPLHYMTSEQFIDIVTNNPYIDKIIPWSERLWQHYAHSVNPHMDKIGPGHWGRNSNSILADFYWKILDIEPDDFFIDLKEPKFSEEEDIKIVKGGIICTLKDPSLQDQARPICILHTTGGDSRFRIYKFMKMVHEGLKDRYFTIQLGGINDYPAWAHIDLRGKLSFRETAWIMDKASIAVTVDSFVSHLAGVLGVSQVCLFGSGNYNVVQPKQIKGQLVCLIPDYVKNCPGLGPCSASIRDCPATCTGRHDPKTILKAIEKIEEEEGIWTNL